MSSFTERVIGAARLESRIYEEVEHDTGAMGQAVGVVLLSSVAAGIGSMLYMDPVTALIERTRHSSEQLTAKPSRDEGKGASGGRRRHARAQDPILLRCVSRDGQSGDPACRAVRWRALAGRRGCGGRYGVL